MGIVYHAHDTLLNRSIAVKVLTTAGLGTAGKTRLLLEAQAAAKLNHPNIVAVYDAGEAEDQPFIVMELVAGSSLRHYKPQNLDEAVNLARQICLALEHAHANGIIHRDLKPDNIVIAPQQTAKLMDFGLARTADSPHLTEEGGVVGTFAYLAPELIQGQPASVQSDLYALGVMLYELFAGRPPFDATNVGSLIMQHLQAPVVPPRQYNSAIPSPVDTLVVQLLNKQPSERPNSAAVVRDVLDNLFQTSSRGLTAVLAPILQQTRHNLPRQLTSFIGREKEIGQLQKLLINPETRLITLTGPGGTGKTRLSLQAASTLLEAFPDGVWLVELAPLADPALVLSTVVAIFNLREDAERPLQTVLADYLQTKHLLLILDNCEHLIEACAQLTETVLQTCPQVTILTSSRESLGIPGEIPVRIPPLAVPDPRHLPPLETLQQVEAVRLFTERAKTVLPNFALTPQNVTAVIQICQRLDGIPLAIELAAARVKVLQVEQIAKRLDDRFRLLTGGSRTALPRQQTLRALIDWSYDLLSEQEKVLLRRLSVFAGGWMLETAETVCADAQMSEYDILDLLTQLVNKSLVIAERAQGEETRYRMLETIRQYARDKLLETGEGAEIRQRHLQFFGELAETAVPKLHSHQQPLWLNRLEDEYDNLRAALEWACDSNPAKALQLTADLIWFWDARSYCSEGIEWYTRVINLPGAEAPSRGRAGALVGIGWLFWQLGEYQKAKTYLQESITISRQINDPHNLLLALCWLNTVLRELEEIAEVQITLEECVALSQQVKSSWLKALVLANQGFFAVLRQNPQEAQQFFEGSAQLYQQVGDKGMQGYVLANLSTIYFQRGDYPTAEKLLRESLSLSHEVGTKIGVAWATNMLGDVALRQKKVERAESYFQQSLLLFRHLGDKSGTVNALGSLGQIARLQQNYPQAETLLQESLELSRAMGHRAYEDMLLRELALVAISQNNLEKAEQLLHKSLQNALAHQISKGIVYNLDGLAVIWARQGKHKLAIHSLSAVTAWRTQHTTPRHGEIATLVEATVTNVRSEVGSEVFDAFWAEGLGMGLETAVLLATGQ